MSETVWVVYAGQSDSEGDCDHQIVGVYATFEDGKDAAQDYMEESMRRQRQHYIDYAQKSVLPEYRERWIIDATPRMSYKITEAVDVNGLPSAVLDGADYAEVLPFELQGKRP